MTFSRLGRLDLSPSSTENIGSCSYLVKGICLSVRYCKISVLFKIKSPLIEFRYKKAVIIEYFLKLLQFFCHIVPNLKVLVGYIA